MSREHALAIVSNANLSLLTRSNRLLGISRYSTTAAGNSLVDDKRFVAHVGESNRRMNGLVSFFRYMAGEYRDW